MTDKVALRLAVELRPPLRGERFILCAIPATDDIICAKDDYPPQAPRWVIVEP